MAELRTVATIDEINELFDIDPKRFLFRLLDIHLLEKVTQEQKTIYVYSVFTGAGIDVVLSRLFMERDIFFTLA